MKTVHEPLLTTEMSQDDLVCEAGSLYLHSHGPEERSLLDADWIKLQSNVRFEQVVFDGASEQIDILGKKVALRDRSSLRDLFVSEGMVYLDLTGMTYSVWAPLLATVLESNSRCVALYREPVDYRRSAHPARGMIYDLSERISGIAPLPGLASIRLRAPKNSVLVPLLGFEGARLAHVLESTDPDSERVIPVVGAPGFRPEYVTQALLSNRISLEQETHFSRIQFAKANCPFDLFHELVKIQAEFEGAFLRIAPIGTKPHGLGAVLFALARPGKAEIVYDHPIRSSTRTSGASRVCLYDVSVFAESEMFLGVAEYG